MKEKEAPLHTAHNIAAGVILLEFLTIVKF